jgi:hypothetical protein
MGLQKGVRVSLTPLMRFSAFLVMLRHSQGISLIPTLSYTFSPSFLRLIKVLT